MPVKTNAADVIVVDDQESIRNLTARWLEHAGYRVRAVASADEAAAMLDEVDPAVIVSDVRLPDRDGVWLGRQVREASSETALVFMSGDASSGPTVARAGLGAFDYLAKPFSRTQLLEAVDRGVAWHEDRVVRRQQQTEDDAAARIWSRDEPSQRWVQHADWLPSPAAIGRLAADLGLSR